MLFRGFFSLDPRAESFSLEGKGGRGWVGVGNGTRGELRALNLSLLVGYLSVRSFLFIFGVCEGSPYLHPRSAAVRTLAAPAGPLNAAARLPPRHETPLPPSSSRIGGGKN